LTVREVVLHRDIRACADFSPATLLNRHHLRRFLSVFVLIGIDVAAIALAAPVVVALMRIIGPAPRDASGLAVTGVCLVVVLVFLANGLYGRRFMRHSARRLARASLMAIAVVAVAALVMGFSLDHVAAALTIVLAAALAFAARAAYDWVLARIYGDSGLRPVVLVGRPDSCEQIKALVAGLPQFRDCRIRGVITDRAMTQRWQEENDLRILGLVDDLEAVVDAEQPVELIVCDLDLTRGRIPGLIDACRRHHVDLKVATVEADLTRERVSLIPNVATPLFVAAPPELAVFHFVAKRCFDLIGAAVLTVLLAPLMLVVAALVKLTSRGPVLFVDERIGLGQRTFRCYKFRTMQRDAAARQAEVEPLNEAGGTLFKIRLDPRVTPLGRLLRRTSVDEIPQLFNVLKGDMSLVGPRPLPLRDFRLMDDIDKRRHVVLPGITGLWQVSGRSDLAFADMVALDFHYIESWSIAADLSILARTVGAVCGLRGAC
jgi:exopolysaccharide biosynthesis polyprenyl glycosylphosphotransferase